jgi:anti-sigma factor RsiW
MNGMAEDQLQHTTPGITCQEVAAWTSAYLADHLEDADKIRMALHLASCAGCGTYVQQIGAVRDMLALLPGPAAKPAVQDRLREAFAARQPGPPPKP